MKTLTWTLLCLTVLTLACGTLFAADKPVPDLAITVASGDIHPDVVNNAKLKTIYSNLGSKSDAYDDFNGFVVSGPNTRGGQEWLAYPFTPKANATVTQIQIAVEYDSIYGGTNGFNLVLAADASGVPGKSLHSWDFVKNLPNFDTCCKLDTAKYAEGVVVEKGKQYWVVARTDSKSTDAYDVWCSVWNDSMSKSGEYNVGSGWQSVGEGWVLAFAVQGK